MTQFREPPSWIFFDLDGTLWDHAAACRSAVMKVCERYGVSPMTFHPLFVESNEQLWVQLANGEITFAELNVRRFEMALDRASAGCCAYDAQEVADYYIENYIGPEFPLPGARDAVRHASRSASLAILTNGQRFTQEVKLSHLGREAGLFSFMLCAADIPAVKPQDAFFAEALGRAGDPPRQSVWMVGDNWEEDVVCAERFGFGAVWLSHGRPVPDRPNGRIHVIEDIRGLPDLLDRARGQEGRGSSASSI